MHVLACSLLLRKMLTETILGQEVFICLTGNSPSMRETKVGRCRQKLKQTLEECYLMGCSPWLVQLPFLYSPDLLAHWWHHPLWTGPSNVNQQSRKCPMDMLMGQANESNSSVEVSSSYLYQVHDQNFYDNVMYIPFIVSFNSCLTLLKSAVDTGARTV